MDHVARQRLARERGVAARLDESCTGWSGLAMIEARGPEAASWLQSQTTNDVEALAVGQGHLNARVARTGHLTAVFSLHRVQDQVYWLILPAEDADGVLADLDAFLFADQVTLRRMAEAPGAALSGPITPTILERLGLPTEAPEGAELEPGLFRRAFTGDDGLLAVGDAAVTRLLDAAESEDVHLLHGAAFSELVDGLRQEAGLIRIAVDLASKKRLLPETGLEQIAVSYTKGCYLGQEVIARVRTYGSVPNALRALILDGDDLGGLPPVGQAIVADDGTRLGHAASRTWSGVTQSAVMLAFLGRKHRTPGTTWTLRTPGGLRTAKVALLPLHRVADQVERVAMLYDQGVRAFAEGDPDAALAKLEQALRLDPEHADAYEAIGVILARTERFHEAIDVFRRLEEVAPNEPLVNTNLSLYYMKIGDRETAEAQASLAARKSMSQSTGQTATELAEEADAARRADADRKARMFRQVLDFDPVDPIALFGLGSALSVLARWEQAAEVLERAQAADARNAAVYLTWGKALERLGRDEQAVGVYRQGMDVASQRGDLMPLREMENRVLLLT